MVFLKSTFSFVVLQLVSGLSPEDLSTKSPYFTVRETSAFQEHSCSPIYLSSVARHGSRTASSESKYLFPQDYLLEAFSSGMLTRQGKAALKWSQELYATLNSENISWGGLTPLGKSEHYSIGARTFERFQQLFAAGSKVIVECTEVQRTQDSRDSFIAGMVSRGADSSIFELLGPPSCDLHVGFDYSKLRFFDVCDAYTVFIEDNPLLNQLSVVRANYSLFPNREMHNLFFDPYFTSAKSHQEQVSFTSGFYDSSCGTQVDYNLDFSKLCSTISQESGVSLSYVADLEEYVEKGPLADYPFVTDMSCPFFSSLLADLDNAVGAHEEKRENTSTAHLRFAHAETMIPILSALGLISEDPFIWAGGDVSMRQFNGHFVSSMATNLMVTVLDCGEEGYKAQLLQNEKVVKFPFCSETLCPLESVRSFLASKACDMSAFEELCGGLTCPSD